MIFSLSAANLHKNRLSIPQESRNQRKEARSPNTFIGGISLKFNKEPIEPADCRAQRETRFGGMKSEGVSAAIFA